MIYYFKHLLTKFSLIWCFWFLWLFLFIFSNYLFAQSLRDFEDKRLNYIGNLSIQKINLQENTLKNKISYPSFTPYLGAGLLPGGRVGLIARFIENVSIEFSYGNDLRNFIAASDEEIRFGIGGNYHFSTLPLHINLYYIHGFRNNSNTNSDKYGRYLYSLNVGYMPNKKGLTPFARIGLYYETYNDIITNEITSGSTYFNFDLGIGWTFSL